MSERRAIVVGHRGQDGRLLAGRLVERGDSVLGIDCGITEHVWDGVQEEPLSIIDRGAVKDAVRRFRPDEIYHLAAHHRSSQEARTTEALGDEFLAGLGVSVEGVVNFLDAMNAHAPTCRFFYASSSLIFGFHKSDERQDEHTPWTPSCEYGLMKALGMQACRLYREEVALFASSGILYNHESVCRREEFLSKKIALAALRIRGGSHEKLALGDLDAVTDWSYAPDFVDAFQRILSLDRPGDFIVASGEGHTVREFVAVAFAHLGLDWREHVTQVPELLHRTPSARIGNPQRLMSATGWQPTLTFSEMVCRLVDETAREQGL